MDNLYLFIEVYTREINFIINIIGIKQKIGDKNELFKEYNCTLKTKQITKLFRNYLFYNCLSRCGKKFPTGQKQFIRDSFSVRIKKRPVVFTGLFLILKL